MATEGGDPVVHEERSNTTEQATEQHAEQNAADAVKEKEEKPTEGKVEQKTRAGLTEIATPGHLPQETSHFFQCSSVKSVSVSWDENLRFRKSMEDAHVIVDQLEGKAEQGYFAIYDGHGGTEAVIYTANHLHQKVLEEELTKGDDYSEALKQAYLLTDKQIGEKKVAAGTTAVSALIVKEGEKKMLYVANAGDARAVLSRGGKAERMSHDHKTNDEGESQRIKSVGGFIILNRVNGVLAVTRSLGDTPMKEYVTGEPYIQTTEITAQDTHLVLACDGLWDVASDQEVVDFVHQEGDEKALSEKLVQHALKKGSTDNISVMVITL
ncbi:hypothetical protein PROFUN_09406 [Planoprotostelium fungivorum]|uniref:PPM-type phosphatase domain-containing protein n=1 Tax=Planoprotostelium fungivorum TaxID=1890364 RepID=A0A2P6NHE5_9EUKA|nr:hypothetical protein PROFUN_09406 [Planoprotostelium fungivorum]